MATRILFTFLLVFSVLFMPIWLSIILMILGMFYFSMFWEGVAVFFISDILYGVEGVGYFNTIFISTILGFIMLLIVEFSKKKLKFYPLIKT